MRHDVEPLVTSKDLARSIPPVAGEIVPLGSVIVFFNTYNNTRYNIIVGYNLICIEQPLQIQPYEY